MGRLRSSYMMRNWSSLYLCFILHSIHCYLAPSDFFYGSRGGIPEIAFPSGFIANFYGIRHSWLYALAFYPLGLPHHCDDYRSLLPAAITTGGIKVFVWLSISSSEKWIQTYSSPNAILPVRVNKQVISIQSHVLAFTFLYVVIVIISVLVMMGLESVFWNQ